MKLKDILHTLKPFAGIAASFIPGGPAIVAAVNEFLPDADKLPDTATGGEVMERVAQMPPEQRAAVMEKEVDLAIAREEGWTERYKAMCDSDGQSTRPRIALLMAWMLAIPYVLIGLAMVYVVATGEAKLADLWPTLLAYLGVPLGILNKYFGELRREQGQRLGIEKKGLLAGIFGSTRT